MFFFCNRSSNNSAIRPLRLKFPLALNSPQHVEGAGGRQLPRDEAFGCSTDENSCYSPGKRDLNNKLFVQSGLKDFAGCAHRAASHKRPEQRVRFPPAAPGDKLQSPYWRPQILVREREELEAPVSTGGFLRCSPGQGVLGETERTRGRDLAQGSTPVPSPIPGGIPQAINLTSPPGEQTQNISGHSLGDKVLHRHPQHQPATELGRRWPRSSAKPLTGGVHLFEKHSDIPVLSQTLRLYQATPVHRHL